jgi:dTDP-glucose pyrophosphorylase
MTTFLIPAAGRGSRFGAPYAKELHALRRGVTVMDIVMHSLHRLALPELRVVIVISADKLDLVRYLEPYAKQLALSFVYQNDAALREMPAALMSAEPFCDDVVVVYLADQIYLGDPSEALAKALHLVETGAQIVAVATPCTDPQRLTVEGALAVDHAEMPSILHASEKPSHTGAFNACWSALVCRRTSLHRLANEIAHGLAIPCLAGAPIVWGPDFVNITTPADAQAWTLSADAL